MLILFLKQRKKQQLDNGELPRKDIESEKIPLTEESQEQKVSLLQSSTAKIEDEVTEAVSEDEEIKSPKFSPPLNPLLQEIQANRIFNKQKSLLSEDKLKDLAEAGLKPVPTDLEPMPTGFEPMPAGLEPVPPQEEDDLPPPPPTPPLEDKMEYQENLPEPLLNGDTFEKNDDTFNASDELVPSPPPPQDIV